MKYPEPIYLVSARRSPIGRFGGGLKALPPTELAVQVAEAVVPGGLKHAMEQVIVGQVLQAGAGMNVARQVGLKLGLPQTVPAFTVNMACASGLQAVALAASAIALGESALVLAGGVEVMSRAPHYVTDLRWGRKLGAAELGDAMLIDGLCDPVLKTGMGDTAERIAEKFRITREAQDAFAFASQQRVAANRDALRREIVPIAVPEGSIADDEHPRADTTPEKLAQLKPAFRPDGTVTAGNSSGINDGAAFVLVSGATALRRHGLEPRARIVGAAVAGCDPSMMGMGPVHAVRRLFEQTGWNPQNVDAFEINEAFAVQTIACAQELGLEADKLNQRGGAIALGHPIGCSGARVLVTLLHILEDGNLKRGIASLCVGGGMGIAMAIERE